MKTIQFLSITLITLTLLGSCSEKKDEKTKSDEQTKEGGDSEDEKTTTTILEGNWEIKRATGEKAELNIGMVYTFSGNSLNLSYNQGTTVVTDKTFSFQTKGNDLKFIYDYKIEGDTLVVSLQDSGHTYYMVKQ